MGWLGWEVVAAVAVGGILALALVHAALPWIIQPVLRAVIRARYRVRVVGIENVPKSGPLLVVANHSTWLDGFLMAAFIPRRGKAMVSALIVDRPIVRSLAIRSGIIPTPFSGPKAIRGAIDACREALDAGYAVGLFPEGQISRNGFLGPFQRGLELILKGRDDVQVVPLAIDNLWGSIFSRSDGRFFRKWPRGWRRTVSIVIGPPVARPVTAAAARLAILEAGVAARALTGKPSHPLETIDLSLPHWQHPTLGLLTASTPDIHLESADVHQLGLRPGSVGLIVPGVAIRECSDGRLEALVPQRLREGWIDTGHRGRVDRQGFVHLEDEAPTRESA